MKKNTWNFLSAYLFLNLLLFIAGIHHAEGQPIQKIPQPAGKFGFSGMIGHTATSATISYKSIPEKQLISECTFFTADSLSGFDFGAASKRAEADNAIMYGEFKAFLFREQVKFIKNKYHIALLASEIKANGNTVETENVVVGPCSNLDFEDGGFGSWSGTQGYNTNSNAPFTTYPGNSIPYNTNGSYLDCQFYELITKAYGNDYYGGFPGVSPGGGNYSARVGGEKINEGTTGGWGCGHPLQQVNYSCAEELKQTFVVTAANALLTYQFAVVLNDGGHLYGEQPYFEAVVTDKSGNPLSGCTQYYQQIVSGATPPGFTLSPYIGGNGSVYYLPWRYNSVNLTPYIGQTVTVNFISSGCSLGAHFGYAYVDATCGPAQIKASNYSPCSGSNITLTSPVVAGGTYSWTGPGIVGSTTGQSVTVNASGTYSVTVTPSQGANCKYTLGIQVNFSNISAAIVSSSNVSCNGGNNGSATVNPSGGNPAYTYAWNNGQTTSTATGLIIGTYTVKVTDAGNCVKSSTVSITQPNILAITTSSTAGGCTVANGTATANPSGGTGAYTYSWLPGGQTSQTATGLSTGTYTLLLTDHNACIKTNTVSIGKTSNPFVTLSSTKGGCTVANGTATASPSGGTGAYTYSWLPGGQTSQIATGLSTGTYTLLLTDHNGCNKTDTISIGKTSDPSVAVSSTQGGCTVANGTATAIPSGGTGAYTYSWLPGGQTSQTATGLSTGTYTLLLTDNNGCTKTNTVSIISSAAPMATVSNILQAPCGSNSGSASASASGGSPGYFYLWMPGGYTTPLATGLAAGIYTVTVTDTNGCKDIKTATITSASGPSATSSVNANVLCFEGNNGSATVHPSAGTPGYTFLWSNGQTSQTATGLIAGNYNVIVKDAYGCSISTSCTITQPAKALTVNTVTSGSSCGTIAKGVISSNVSNGTGPYSYLWSNGQTSQTISNLLAGTYTLTVTDANGCIKVNTPILPANIKPVANFSSAPAISCEGVYMRFTDASTNALTWNWNFGDAGSSTTQNPALLFPYNGTYPVTLIVTNPPCADTLSKSLAIADMSDYFKIAETNVFTPNGDGVNDCFLPSLSGTGADTLKDCLTLEVFDRWGIKMFESDGANKCWNGNNRKDSKPALDGIYFYVAKLGKITSKGYVTLLRHK